MSALAEKLLKAHLDTYASTLGFDPRGVEQQSYEWHKMRLGVITGSMVSKVLMGKDTQGRQTYMAQLAAEVATGEPKEFGSFKQTEWGNENEPKAIETYQFITGSAVSRVPFLYAIDNMRCGASPDGVTDDRGVEIKCPYTSEMHLMALTNGFMKKDYQWQVQFSMWVSGLNRWDFCSFDPRMKRNNLHIIECEASEKHQATLSDAIPQFIHEMNQMLEAAGFQWGEQWQDMEQAYTPAPTFADDTDSVF